GRGTEEIEFASAHGIVTAVVAGISSAIAVPASLNIPVTARGVSESFWVDTGTTKNGEISSDVALAAQSSATVVILMGLKRIDKIMECFIQHGKSETPVAVIQDGTLASQRNYIGTVSTIARLTKNDNAGSPAIIIIGEVVKYAGKVEKIIDSKILKNYE